MIWIDIIIALCIGFGLIRGLLDGIVKQVFSFLSLVSAILFAGIVASQIRSFIVNHSILTGISSYVITGVCYILAFSAIALALYWLGRILTIALHVTPAVWLDYLLGGIFGAVKWILALSLVFNLLAVFDPHSHVISKQSRENSVLYKGVERVVPTVYPYVKHYFFKD